MELILYGQASCSSCSVIKSYLKANELEYTYVDVETEKGYEAYQSDFPGSRSVPQAVGVDPNGVNGDVRISGAENIMKFLRSSKEQ